MYGEASVPEKVHCVLILGGGFGGLSAAQALKRAPVQVTLVDRTNFHLFQPLLYQVATGALSPGEIAAPLRVLLRKQKNARVLMAEAVSLDAQARQLILDDGALPHDNQPYDTLPYDTLIVAAGARSYYFGN